MSLADVRGENVVPEPPGLTWRSGAVKRSPTLLAAVALYALILAAKLLFILDVLAERPETTLLFGKAFAIWLPPALGGLIDAVLLVGLWYCRPWARWLTMLRFAVGVTWGFYDLSETSRRAGGFEFLYSYTRSTAYFSFVEWGVAAVLSVLLLLPSTGQSFDRSPFSNET